MRPSGRPCGRGAGALEESGDRVDVETAERQRRRAGGELGELRLLWVVGRRHLVVPVGADQQHRLERRVTDQGAHEIDRRRVRPVQVLEDDYHGPFAADDLEDGGDRVESFEHAPGDAFTADRGRDMLRPATVIEQPADACSSRGASAAPQLGRGGEPQRP